VESIGEWLAGLGLSEYAQRFAENGIDPSVLPDLTDRDLKELGVLLGHRRKMLRAIAQLGPLAVPQTAPQPMPQDEAERRQLTVMFCDLVGSTALSGQLDPEDMREVIAAYQAACASIMPTYEGFIAKLMGDGILAYFGYPRAHEDDAERAIRAGLAIVDAVGRLQTKAAMPLRIRIGIATGVVVVGDLIGEGVAQEQAVVGETPNLAARLQSLAEPQQIIISGVTRRLTGRLFEYRDLGTVALKGFAEPIRAWQVLGLSGVDSRFEARHETGLTPLVGREEELALLRARWAQAVDGEGRVVLLAGEPGIGKSRLTAALIESLERESYLRLRYFCSPWHNESALFPVISQLERAAGFERADTSSQKLIKLEALIDQSGAGDKETVAILADLLSLPTEGRYSLPQLTPQKRKEKILAALFGQLEVLSTRQPVLMLFEDVHWIDPTSLELLVVTVERAARLRALLLITARPEFTSPWPSHSHVTTLALTRLSRRDTLAVIDRVTGGTSLPNEVMDQILVRTDGVPLFVEELTKTVLESGFLRERDGQYVLSGPLPLLAIPTTLHDSLLSRLDRLGSARALAQIGAAIGREFPYDLLIAVTSQPPSKVDEALAQLVRSELVFCRGEIPQAVYSFKHVLVRDAAYSSLLRSQRQQLHALIAAAIEAQFPDIVEAQPALLAQHCNEAGWSEKAALYWRRAGEQAVHRGANVEAIEHFRRALLRNAERSQGTERSRTELAILSQLGPALMSIQGWAAEAVGEVLERATNVARQLEASRDLAAPLTSLWLFRYARGELDRADEMSEEIFRIAHELNDSEVALQAHHTAGPMRWVRGLYSEANEHFEACAALYDEDRHVQHRYRYMGHDPGVCAMTVGASVKWALGYPDQAADLEREALVLARRLRHVPSLAHALSFNAESQIWRRDIAGVTATAWELLPLCHEHRLAQPEAVALIALGWAMVHLGDVTDGVARLEGGLHQLSTIGLRTWLPRAKWALAEGYLAAGRYDEGLEEVSRAMSLAGEIGLRFDLPRLHLLRGELLLHASRRNIEIAESCFRSAFEIAGEQGAHGWALRAMTSVARVLADRGERGQAYDLLAPVYADFTEGFDTRDLEEARTLLNELR
jgi:predicted ATPase/class 3 adenylate cyclase